MYAVIFIDAIQVKIREGQVANRPSTSPWASPWTGSVTCWACGPGSTATGRARSTGCESAGNQEPRDAGRADGGLRRAERTADAVECRLGEDHRANLHRPSPAELIRYASKRDWAQIAKDLKPVYTAASNQRHWTGSPSSPANGRNATPRSSGYGRTRGEFVPFLRFDRK